MDVRHSETKRLLEGLAKADAELETLKASQEQLAREHAAGPEGVELTKLRTQLRQAKAERADLEAHKALVSIEYAETIRRRADFHPHAEQLRRLQDEIRASRVLVPCLKSLVEKAEAAYVCSWEEC